MSRLESKAAALAKGGVGRSDPVGALTAEEEARLVALWKAGYQQALDRLILVHRPLVLKAVRAIRACGLPEGDLRQEGMLGLMEAAHRFDPQRGFRFSTLALWWVRARLMDYLMRNASIVPFGRSAGQKRLFFKLRKVRAELGRLAGAAPDQIGDMDIAAALAVSPAEVAAARARLDGRDRSLNQRLGPEGDAEALDLLADPAPDPEQTVLGALDGDRRSAWLVAALKALSERERALLERRWLAEAPPTLKELGAAFGISAERVRQIEEAALNKLRRQLAQSPWGAEQMA